MTEYIYPHKQGYILYEKGQVVKVKAIVKAAYADQLSFAHRESYTNIYNPRDFPCRHVNMDNYPDDKRKIRMLWRREFEFTGLVIGKTSRRTGFHSSYYWAEEGYAENGLDCVEPHPVYMVVDMRTQAYRIPVCVLPYDMELLDA